MATIYRFIVEQGTSKGAGGRSSGENSKKSTGKSTTLLKMIGGGEKGGVEHNRKLRAINPLLNRLTGGYWERGMRVGRAALGLVKFKTNAETGQTQFAGLSGPAIAIIIAFAIQMVMKYHAKQIANEQEKNRMNYKAMENGVGAIRGQYETATNFWSGKISYNQNK